MNVSSSSNIGGFLTSPRQGIERAFSQANEAGKRIADGDLDVEGFTDLNDAEAQVKANVAVMRTADEMVGTLLNVRA